MIYTQKCKNATIQVFKNFNHLGSHWKKKEKKTEVAIPIIWILLMDFALLNRYTSSGYVIWTYTSIYGHFM